MQTRIDVSHPHGLPLVPLRILPKVGIFGLEENIVLYVSSGVLIIPIFWTGRYDARRIPDTKKEEGKKKPEKDKTNQKGKDNSKIDNQQSQHE